jgi:hypothetical protein
MWLVCLWVHSSQLNVGRIQPSITEDNGEKKRDQEKSHPLENGIAATVEGLL